MIGKQEETDYGRYELGAVTAWVVLALILSRTALGEMGIWLSWPVGWVVATVISLSYYRVGPWCKDGET